ncbi:ATP-dependent helicase [Halanaerobium praevalens]|uniref:DNA 3'-5' helicase n=1 Tax=Halanaerobium praevalens (strain ATCC 33744 / DSM 2228 / GSL) TaxID=572479 RepID=E3DPH1_HALPG|nr:UvrD-helicase domain-containing protein [Halanaerobium praevalens]ADO77733.1 UvrD/REP helicase [Halanaerobium praevalens DSM 2228]
MNFKPRPGQKEVLEYRGGQLAVPAVPGAGKTTVLAHLAAELIASELENNQKLLIVTYMNSAVANFRQRIGDFLAAKGLPRSRGYSVKTLHSLALQIIKEKPEARLINQDFELIEAGRRYRWIKDLSRKWAGENGDLLKQFFNLEQNSYKFDKYLKKWKEDDFPAFVASMISYFKLKLLAGEELKNMVKYSNLKAANILTPAAEIFSEYEFRLAQAGLLDFDDLVQQSLKMLKEDPEFAERIGSNYAFVFEDEAQDSNQAQEEMLYLLAGKDNNLVRVGDSNQAITGTFTLSDPDIFRSYCKKEAVKVETMAVSSRSSQDIIDLANYLVDWSQKEFSEREIEPLEKKYIQATAADDPAPNPKVSGYRIGNKAFKDWKTEKKFIARQALRKALEDNKETTAILMPTGWQLEELAREINNLGGEFQLAGSSSKDVFLTELEVVLKFLTSPAASENLKLLFVEIFQKEDLDLVQLLEDLLAEKDNQDLIFPLSGLNRDNFRLEFKKRAAFEPLFKSLVQLQGWLEASMELPPDELVLFLAERLKLSGKKLALAQNLALEFGRLLNENPGWRLDQLTAELPEIRDRIKQFAETLTEMEGFESKPDQVTLSTLHKAKGMEWDTVFIGSLTSSHFQHDNDDYFMGEKFYLNEEIKNPKASARAELEYILNEKKERNVDYKARQKLIAERVRLLYVGLTRARKNLFLSTHLKKGNWDKEPAFMFKALAEFIKKNQKKEVKKGRDINGSQ